MTTGQTRTTRLRFAAGGLAAALALAACGGSDGGSAGGGSAGSWCDFADESDVVDDIFSSLASADAAAVESGLKQVETFVKRLPSEAPAEISDDAKKVAENTQMLIDAVAAADYNILDADLSFMQDSNLETELDEAGSNIDAYTEKECGRPFGSGSSADTVPADGTDEGTVDGPSSTDDAFNPGDGTIREQLIAQFESIGLTTDEAGCIADNLDFSDPAVQSGDIASMLDVFETCGIGIDRLSELGSGG